MAGPCFLPDDQLAAIAWADDTVSNVALAEHLGVPRDRVWATRRRIKDAGHWSFWSVRTRKSVLRQRGDLPTR